MYSYCKSKGIANTTHMIFGIWVVGTLIVVGLFDKNKLIFKQFKKFEYCFVIPVSRINNSTKLFEEKDMIDSTETFLNMIYNHFKEMKIAYGKVKCNSTNL